MDCVVVHGGILGAGFPPCQQTAVLLCAFAAGPRDPARQQGNSMLFPCAWLVARKNILYYYFLFAGQPIVPERVRNHVGMTYEYVNFLDRYRRYELAL